MNKSPVVLVKEKFGDKAGLVKAVQGLATDELWLGRTNEDKGLAHVSNAKLLRLHGIFTDVKAKFGTRAKLIDAICELDKRVKDEGYKARLAKFPVPRLWDMYRSSKKRTTPKAPKVKTAPAAKAAPAVKTAAKGGAKSGAKSGGKAAPKKGVAKGSPTKPNAKKTSNKKK